VKPGDLVVWTKYASEWSGGPDEGALAGTVVRVIPPRRRRRSRAKVEVLADELFIVGRRMVEVISES
jgi:hypothetical protein